MRYSTTKESYSEVFEIINLLGNEYKNKIPKKLYKFIEEHRDKKYIPKFHLKNIESLNCSSVSRKAIAIIAFLNQNYWNQDQNNIEKLGKIYTADQERFEEEVIESYDDELLCNSGPDLDTEENILPVFETVGIFKKLKRKIWNIIFKRNTKK